jgi:hypothetical protein
MWERGERKQVLDEKSTNGIDVAKWEKGTGRNTQWRRKEDKMSNKKDKMPNL